jgi:hypothetical protein
VPSYHGGHFFELACLVSLCFTRLQILEAAMKKREKIKVELCLYALADGDVLIVGPNNFIGRARKSLARRMRQKLIRK